MELKSRYKEAFADYREKFVEHSRQMAEETGLTGQMHVSSGGGKFNLDMPRESSGLDLSGMPRPPLPAVSVAAAITPAVTDFGLILLAGILSFVVAFAVFRKYDVR
jgi:hypothetical protein